MDAPLIIAVPSKGRLKEQVEAWLADCALKLEAEGGARGYMASLKGLEGAQVRLLSAGDIAEAMNAAARIGDDTLQRGAGRVPRPETFTHGTSEQRQSWFATGYETGDITACDTFSAERL